MTPFRLFCFACACTLSSGLFSVATHAQEDMSKEDIIKALMNGAPSNSAVEPEAPATPGKVEEPEPVIPVEEPKAEEMGAETKKTGADMIEKVTEAPVQGQIDLQILFERNSDDIDPKSYKQLITLATALSSDGLSEQRILIAGHTDARGSDELNLALSKRRANAVMNFIIGVDSELAPRLKAIGMGETELKNSDDPEAAENRRVQILNLGQ